MTPGRARWELLGAALLFGTGGVAIKLTTVSGPWLGGARSAVAALTLALAVPAARRAWSPAVGAVGLAYAATLLLFVSATKATTAAAAILLQDVAPLWVILLSPWLLGERAARRDLVVAALLCVGLVLVTGAGGAATQTAPDPALGAALGVLASVCWALTLLGLRGLAVRGVQGAGAAAALWGNVVAAAVSLPWLPWPALTSGDLVALVWLGVFQTGVAYVLMTRAMGSVSAVAASLLLLAEPVASTALAWAVLGEVPAARGLAGGAVILGALALQALGSAGAEVAPSDTPRAAA